jgi:hypothetical protein
LYDQLRAGILNFTSLEDENTIAYVDPAHSVRVPEGRAAARAIRSAARNRQSPFTGTSASSRFEAKPTS